MINKYNQFQTDMPALQLGKWISAHSLRIMADVQIQTWPTWLDFLINGGLIFMIQQLLCKFDDCDNGISIRSAITHGWLYGLKLISFKTPDNMYGPRTCNKNKMGDIYKIY